MAEWRQLSGARIAASNSQVAPPRSADRPMRSPAEAPMPGIPAGNQYRAMTIKTTGQAMPVPLRRPHARAQWLTPAGLLLLSLIPVLGGAFRLTELTGGAEITAQNARFFDSPIPVVTHIVSVTVYSLLGAFQFVPALRTRRGWHRIAGRVLIPAGLLVALSGLWMTVFYALPPQDGALLLVFRLVFGTAMLASLVLGVLAIRRRDYEQHSAWMTRAYAIALGAGTQALILIVPELLSSRPGVTARGVLMGTGWLINLAVAEYVIRRRAAHSRPRTVLSADEARPGHSYDEGVTGTLRSLWTAPGAVPPPPRRVWRDWGFLAVIVLLALFEGLIRSDEPWALLATAVLVAVAPTVLWRRTHPAAMLATAFATLGILGLVIGDSHQLYTSALLLVLPYSLFRWGTGRAIMLGAAILLADLVVTAFGPKGVADSIGLLIVTVPIVTLAVALRYRAHARMREIDQAKLREREQLARDLHDTVAHHVSAIAIRAQAGIATAGANPDAATDALGLIEAEASKTLAEMRSMVRVLRRDEAPELAPNPRLADLDQLASRGEERPQVTVQVNGGSESIPPTVAAAVYRIVQESVTNARRHARHATRITVRVDANDAGIHLSITDDGETAPVSAPGYGVTGMVERAALLGGTLEAGRAPGRGWTVTAELPRTGWLA